MSPKVTYDNTGVEESSGGGTGVKAPPAVYVARIERVTKRDAKKDGSSVNDLEVVLNVGDEYDWLWSYVGLDKASDWKLAEFTRALGMPEKGGFDPETLKGKLVRVKVNPGAYEGNPSPKVGRFMPVLEDDVFEGSDSAAEATPDGPDDGPDDAAPASAAAGGFEPTREDPEDEDVGAYEDWDDDDLIGEANDRGLTLPGGRGAKRDKAIKALRADDEEAGESPAAEEPEAGAPADDYDEWTLDDLIAEAKDRNLELPKGRKTTEKVIGALREDDAKEPF